MSDLNTYNIYALSERAAVIDFGNTIDETINNKVLAIQSQLKHHPFKGLKDTVAAYSSLTILYDPFVFYNEHLPGSTVFELVKAMLNEACLAASPVNIGTKIISIPVCYDHRFGYDLKLAAAAKNLSTDELVSLHCATNYRIYMLGFLPGFAYMGRLDERLVMPRKSVPRDQVAAGSVGIAGWQTGIYPLNSPGGWHILGRTPLKLFDAMCNPPVVLSAGNTVRFYPISLEAFETYEPGNHVADHH